MAAVSRGSLIGSLDIEEWQQRDRVLPGPTFFTRPAWALALQASLPNMRACPLLVSTRTDRVLLVPLMRIASRFAHWKHYVGMPMGTYTAVFSEANEVANSADASAAIETISHHSSSLALNLWPFCGQGANFFGNCVEHATSVIDLAEGLDRALERMSGNARRMANQANKRGVTCAREVGSAAIDIYYDMLSSAAERWGRSRPTISKTTILAALEYGKDDAQLWIVRFNDEPIGGGIALFGREELFFWTAAMRSHSSVLRPSNALNMRLLEAAAARRLRWFNLGASEGLPGVLRFKQSLGATPAPYCSFRSTHGIYRLYDGLVRFRSAAKHWAGEQGL